MGRFLTWWLAIVAFALLMLAVAGLGAFVATTAARISTPVVGVLVTIAVMSALTAGWMLWAFGPTPSWFRKLLARLS
jgi:hypothetical protein